MWKLLSHVFRKQAQEAFSSNPNRSRVYGTTTVVRQAVHPISFPYYMMIQYNNLTTVGIATS